MDLVVLKKQRVIIIHLLIQVSPSIQWVNLILAPRLP